MMFILTEKVLNLVCFKDLLDLFLSVQIVLFDDFVLNNMLWKDLFFVLFDPFDFLFNGQLICLLLFKFLEFGLICFFLIFK